MKLTIKVKNFYSYLRNKYKPKKSLNSLRLRYINYHRKNPFSFKDDKYFIAFYFQKKMGYPINLRNPKTINEKLNWMKLFDRNPIYPQFSDKWSCRSYVSQKIGSRFLKPIIGVYETVEEVPWQKLPEKFVIKASHGSGWNIICDDRNLFNQPEAEEKLKAWLAQNFYQKFREWQYKSTKPRILVEPYLEGDPVYGLVEYQFYCFNGNPELIQVDIDCNRAHSRLFLSPDWKEMPFTIVRYPIFQAHFPKPSNLEEALYCVSELTKGLPFCRVDLHIIENNILVSEMTLMPGAGYMKFNPPKYDLYLGDLLKCKPNVSSLLSSWRGHDH